MSPTPEERALSYAQARQWVTPEQVAEARAAAASGSAASALAALAPLLDARQRAAVSQIYQGAQQDDLPTARQPPLSASTLSATVAAPPPEALLPPVGDTLPATPPAALLASGGGDTLQATPPPALLSDPAAPDERVGEFEVVREIARGGAGVVYLARHPTLGRQVALKLLLPGTDVSHTSLERFKLEAQVASRLQHPNIVRIYQDGHDQRGRYYFAMDFIEGPSLLERIKERGRLPSREAAQLMLPLAQALAHAHRHSVLHRDLKPHNVLLRASDEAPFLTDFGLAKDVERDAETLTVEGNVMGTPAYMPPEQACGETDLVDRRSDVYSFGATLYHALTGEPPFGGLTLANVLTAVLTQEVTPPRKKVKGVDPDLETICLTCLEKEQDARYPTAQALADDLERYLADKPILARPSGALGRLAKWARRNRGWAWTLVAAGLLLTVGGLVGGGFVLQARSQAQLARWEGEQEARAGFAAEKRDAYLDAARRLETLPKAANRDARTAAALEALTAAQLWLGVAKDDAAAARASVSAALSLAEYAEAGRQWSLAAQSLQLAKAAGADPVEIAERLDAIAAARTAGVAQVKRVFAELHAGERQASPGWQGRAVTDLLRAASEQELGPLLLGELNAYSQRLEEATEAFLTELVEPTAAERAAGERELPTLLAAYRGLLAAEPLARVNPALMGTYSRALYRAGRRALGKSAQDPRAQRRAGQVELKLRQLELDVNALACATVACEAIGYLQSDDPALDEAVTRYLRRLEIDSAWPPAALALLRRGSSIGLQGVVQKLLVAPPDGSFARQVASQLDLTTLDAIPGQESTELMSLIARLKSGLLAQRGDLKRAVETLNDALKQVPADSAERTTLLRSRCRHLSALGMPEAAREDLARLKGLLPAVQLSELNIMLLARELRWVEVKDAVYVHREEVPFPSLDVLQWDALASMHVGDLAGSAELCLDLIQREPRRPVPWRVLAVTHLRRQEFDAAMDAVLRGLELNPNTWELLSLRADIFAEQKQIAEALPLIERARLLAPSERQVELTWARVLSRKGDLKAALERTERALRQNGAWLPGLMMRAKVEAQLGQLAKAEATLRRVVGLAPWENQNKIHGYMLFVELGAKQQAASFYAFVKDTVSPLALLARARRYKAEGQLAAAEAAYWEAYYYYRTNVFVAVEVADFLRKDLGRPGASLPILEALLERARDDPTAWRGYGEALYAQGKTEEARSALETAVSLGGDASASSDLAYMLLLEGNAKRALELCERALSEEPGLLKALGNRAHCHWALGDVERALADSAELLRREPVPSAHWIRARFLLQLGRDAEASEHLRACPGEEVAAALCLAGVTGEEAGLAPYLERDSDWPRRLAAAWLGKLSPELLLKGAEQETPKQTRDERVAAASFYLGWQAERAGERELARERYRLALERGSKDQFERRLAEVRLNALEEE